MRVFGKEVTKMCIGPYEVLFVVGKERGTRQEE